MPANVVNNPLVSVCIPTYNGERYLNEALESLILQTYSPIEIVFSDDASNDRTIPIIEQFVKDNPVQYIIVHHNPSTPGANWNNCMKFAKGKYIKFLFQDDLLLPSCINVMVSFMELHSEIGLIVTKRSFIVDKSLKVLPQTSDWIHTYQDLQRTLRLEFKNGYGLLNKSILKSDQLFKTPLNKFGEPSAFMFRKDILPNIGLFNEKWLQGLDYEFCYRVIKKYPVAILQEKLVRFRLHKHQLSHINEQKGITDTKRFKRLFLRDYFWDVSAFNKLHLLKEFILNRL